LVKGCCTFVQGTVVSVSTPVIVATEATQWETIAVLRKEAAWPGGRIIIDYRGHWVKVMHSFAVILA